MRHSIGHVVQGIFRSYAQVMFSRDVVFGGLLMVVTFLDWQMGLAGLVGILTTQLFASLLHYNLSSLQEGIYTYGPLMSCISAASLYELNFSLWVMLPVLSLMTFIISLFLKRILDKHYLPYLSLPFLLAIWLFLLGAQNFSSLHLQPKTHASYVFNTANLIVHLNENILKIPYANVLLLYLRSLGAIFFNYNELAGAVIFVGLVCFSRIATVLSIYGFLLGYTFYRFFEGDFTPLVYSYIGFNFIITSIAIGGFFLIPTRGSFILLAVIIPITALITAAAHSLFSTIQLPLYSLPFNIATLWTLALVQLHPQSGFIFPVIKQEYSPEMNYDKHLIRQARFGSHTFYRILLPFWGKWFVSQGHDGAITHRDEWKYAWDFDIRDQEGKTYKHPGRELNDYYCFNLPVVAPSYGTVVHIVDGIPDNEIGEVNTLLNWGNTIIIKHGEYLYSKICHLRAGSIRVKNGDFVTPGQIIAHCGNSGRSPEPHIHFQLQATPYIGSKTIAYPISYYLQHTNGQRVLQTFSYPKENEWVETIHTCPLLKHAFHLPPGKTLTVYCNDHHHKLKQKWEVFTDAYNQTYLYCHESNSSAYFVNDGIMFYFTDYLGDKNAALYHFYLAAYRVLLGYYPTIVIHDRLLLGDLFPSYIKVVHDFTMPFFQYTSAHYQLRYVYADNEHEPQSITIRASCEALLLNKVIRRKNYTMHFANESITHFILETAQSKCVYQFCG
ncbi:MAG: urea transporter [Chitinophagales bacterium]|nr:urea transporter [Chitinophagales bacterium]MDW8419452.1 urea transporter [Chitinophagales bacterium]